MAPTLKIIVSAIVLILVAVLALPISNYFLKRNLIETTGGVKEFRPVAQILQSKCVDCHGPGLTAFPIYSQFPIANDLIKNDMAEAQSQMLFSRERLSGQQSFSKLELAKIQSVVENDRMPPPQYRLMHWNGALSDDERRAFLSWIKAQVEADRKH